MTLFLALAACSPDLPDQQATWLTGFHYHWEFFNHRLSYLEVGTLEDRARVSVIGGTSTTSEVPEPLPPECDPVGCQEFPIFDNAEVRIGWGRVSTSEVALGTASKTLEVGADGTKTTITVPVPDGAKGDATALLRGIRLDTDHDLATGPACYRPRYGWHPRRIHVEITGSEVVDDAVEVEVRATFEAGATFDPDRQCIDDVFEAAVVWLEVDVLAVVGSEEVKDADVSMGTTYPFSGDAVNPGEQVELPPEPVSLPKGSAIGWAAIDFQFNDHVSEPRGLYPRSLGFELGEGEASGVATNYSPFTQLWDMSYTFDGVARAVDIPGDIETGTVEHTFPVQLDDVTGDPIVYELEFEP